MRSPNAIGAPIDMQRRRRWLSDFSAFRHQVSEQRIIDWLNQFQQEDRDLAARTLDCVDFISHDQMSAAFRSLLSGLGGWSMNAEERQGKWRFVAYSASAGESADEMMHKFRIANNLAGRQYNEFFIYKSELLRERLTSDDTVIFIDDFAATGRQVCAGWSEIQELLPGCPKTYLFLIAACSRAVKRISDDTDLVCLPHFTLQDRDNIFSEKCSHFTKEDRARLLHYSKLADPNNPKGYGECGLLIVFSHTCPNNTIPILHVRNERWEGLFRRYD